MVIHTGRVPRAGAKSKPYPRRKEHQKQRVLQKHVLNLKRTQRLQTEQKLIYAVENNLQEHKCLNCKKLTQTLSRAHMGEI